MGVVNKTMEIQRKGAAMSQESLWLSDATTQELLETA